MSKKEKVTALKKMAEGAIVDILKVCDQQNALKVRDEFLGHRRRLRLFVSDMNEPYRTHLQDSLQKMPAYSKWFDGEVDRFGIDTVMRVERLKVVLTELLKTD